MFKKPLSIVAFLLLAGAFVLLLIGSGAAQAASTLSAGDLAVVGFNYDDPDEFAFVLLVDVDAGTEIKFTDNGWKADNTFRTGEGILTLTANVPVAAGTVVDMVAPFAGTSDWSTSLSGSLAFSTGGDQILVYQGTEASPTFIYALNSEGTGWQPDATNSNTSALPLGLSNGYTAVALNEVDNAVYAGPTEGTVVTLLGVIGSTVNWSGDDGVRQIMPAGPFTILPPGGPTPTPTTPPPSCATIPEIQGSGNASPCENQYVSNIEGCITGVTNTGFYFQDETGDGDPATSDGIYVYQYSTWTNPGNWAIGDRARVSGQIIEYYDTTEFQSGNSVTIIGSCTPPAAVTVPPYTDPNMNAMTLYEQYEGMRVQMTFDGWVVGATKRFISDFPAGDPEIAFVDFGSAIPAYSRVFEMDYAGYQGINYISGGLDQDLPDLDFGDEIAGTNVTGVLGYQFDKYTLLVDVAPTLNTVDNADVTPTNPDLNALAQEFDVCSFNVENLFDYINDGQGDWGDWAPGWPNSGSPEGQALYATKLADTASVIVNGMKSCQVIGVQEMEGKQQVYNDLAAAVAALTPGYGWTGVYVESGDARDISQGFLYRSDVTLVGSVTPVSGAPYTSWVADGVLDFVRVPAAALFRFHAGTPFQTDIHIYTAHFKSKRSSNSCATPDCTDVREKEAADMRDILAHHQGAGEQAIGGGDLNDTFGSSPIAILEASPDVTTLYANLPASARWSYVFNGESEVLDHMYATNNLVGPALPSLLWQFSFNPIHVHADFPSNERSSDHDPLRAIFGVPDLSDMPAFGTAWHSYDGLQLGATWDGDANDAAGSDNATDDGIAIQATYWHPYQTVNVAVNVMGGGGWLAGWFDWNLNGAFDPGEMGINSAVNAGANTVAVTIPGTAQIGLGAVSVLPARFRLYNSPTDPTAMTTGGVVGGEVEDYNFNIPASGAPMLNLSYTYQMNNGTSGSGFATLLAGQTFVDNGTGGNWTFLSNPARIYLQYSGGANCAARVLGYFTGPTTLQGYRLCQDGSGAVGIWNATRVLSPQ
ncbi:MAG: hypothetical protein H6650_08470 [Ardenticatenales bacterium]|nr:hypothetical protein [Ardenticatenales bacterium]